MCITREIDKEWRGPAKVIGRDGKTVIVKHGGTLREVARVHITRLAKVPLKDTDDNEDSVTGEDEVNEGDEEVGEEEENGVVEVEVVNNVDGTDEQEEQEEQQDAVDEVRDD